MATYPDQQDGRGNLRRPKIIWGILSTFFLLLIISGLFLLFRSPAGPPTADQNPGASFSGMDSFIDSGLTTDQVNGLLKAFSKFAPTAKEVAVDTNSLRPGPHDPNSANPAFNISFKVRIDSTAYQGKANYIGLNIVRLFLYKQGGQLIFDSGTIRQGV